MTKFARYLYSHASKRLLPQKLFKICFYKLQTKKRGGYSHSTVLPAGTRVGGGNSGQVYSVTRARHFFNQLRMWHIGPEISFG